MSPKATQAAEAGTAMCSLIPDWTQLLRAAAELQYDLGGKWQVDGSIVEGSLTAGLTETYCIGLLRPSSIIVEVGLVTSLSLCGSCRTENNVLCNVCQWFSSRERSSTPELGKLGEGYAALAVFVNARI